MIEHKPWMSLPDEDPPERGLAELLAAARVKAEVMASPPWWKRLLAAVRRPPVLALATIVVLIGGVIVVGRHRDERTSSAPTVDLPAGHLDPRARGTVDEEAPPPERPAEERREVAREPVQIQATGGEAQQAPALDTSERMNESSKAELGKAAGIEKGGLQRPVDPLARCRAAAARRDCVAAKTCVKDLGNVDVGSDAALRSCL